MKTTYIVTITYNAGLLGCTITFDTEAEAMDYAKNYAKDFCDCNKYVTVDKYTKKGFFKKTCEVERIYEWEEQ